ncbi:alr0857 family protein [Anabaena sp. PCC 7108]|uniref:alr0857 family protein n=1 Tax=Anabaena sp. PCC 7108 TaxID=163908 RepID=UPI000349EC7B|nr:alr0857 family protein [Anabaena sp. PCC 7108]
MLKLTYTEGSFYLECLTPSIEEWVAQRVILALRVGQPLHFEPSTASFLLPVDLPGVERLKTEVQRHDGEIIALCTCDADYLEVTLQGSWLSDGSEDAVGVFVTMMSYQTEFFLYKLWYESQLCDAVKSAEC